MKNKKIIKESIGRDLVGASKFASKSNVVHQILLKYPTPDKLAASLKEMGDNSSNPKVKAKCNELANKCSSVDVQQYPKFVGDIAGLSKFWTIAGATIGVAGLTAATTYLVKAMSQASQDDSFKNAKGFKDSAKALASKTSDVISQDYDNAKKNIANTKDDVVKGIRDWAGRQIDQSETGKKIASDISKNANDISAEAIARKDADTTIKATADADRAATKAGFADAASARAAIKATADADRADSIRRWNEEQKARQSGDYDLTRRLNGKVSINAPSKLEVPKEALKSAGQTLTDPETYKEEYGPLLKKAKDSSEKAIGSFFDRFGKHINANGYHGMY